jgi:hypothetical protein
MIGQCPLCVGSCETKQTVDATLFRCDECKPFRASRLAIKELGKLTDDQRARIRQSVLDAHGDGKVLEIRVGPVGGNERLTFTRE